MPKRRAVADDSDSEVAGPSSQGSKRARTEDSGYDTPSQAAGPSRRRVRRGNEGDEDEEEDENIEQSTPDEDEEKRFEDEHEDEIRAKLLDKSKAHGGIAEMGIIEKLEMHQFMCHKYLTFTFGPQINFIIGHNGSGKSAVLTALTVALGGKAATTGRGNGLKSFIKEGQSASEVSVTIKNYGDEAFKPQEYGSSIIVTRRFTREGASSYRICAKSGKLVSSNRSELAAICDHMNIQVDNPMNILTQDSARQFLSASSPADKYKFFLRGTQLSQLSEEYSTCLENITQMQKVLVHKSEAIPDLEEALEEALVRFEEAKRARDQKRKADDLKKELAWSYVASKETELRQQMTQCEKQKRRLPEFENKIAEEDAKLEQVAEVVAQYEQDLTSLGTIEHLQAQRTEVLERLKKGKAEVHTIKDDEKRINTELQALKRGMDEMQGRIKEDLRKQEVSTQGKRDEAQRKLDDVAAQLATADAEAAEVKTRHGQLAEESQRIRSEGEAAEAERNVVRERIEAINAGIRRCDESQKSRLAPFGQNMEAVLTDIERSKWVGSKPVGPFGMYVKVKDEQWAEILRNQLGGAMSSFAVTDGRDRAQLSQILQRYKNNGSQIVITERDLFDYSKGEPPQQFLTVLRALEVRDEFVLRILINQFRIESVMLASTRLEGDEMLASYGRGGFAWTSDHYRVQRYPEGGQSSQVLTRLRPGEPRAEMFRNEDTGSRKSELQSELREAEGLYRSLTAKIDERKQLFLKSKTELSSLQEKGRKNQRHISSLRQMRDAIQDEINEDTPVGIQAMQDELDSMERDKQSFLGQFADIQRKLNSLNDTQRPLVQESEDLKEKINDYNYKKQAVVDKVQEQIAIRTHAQHNKEHYSSKLQSEQAKLDGLNKTLEQLEQEFQAWTAKAQEYCDQWPTPRNSEVVKRELEGVSNALKERERKQGATVEDVTQEVNQKKRVLEDTRKELKSMMALNKALRRSIRIRLKKWHEFRRHIALRCKIYFQYHLSIRGYYGKVLFDHVQGTLNLKVQTDDQMSTQTKEKDPRSLSGGEKSFSTICLLLSLWESIGCPIRCLDEFDVFMDAVNRRISMKMMIETANTSDRKQYILITPQDMTNVSIGPTVRVHRMSDPERGQGVLALQ